MELVEDAFRDTSAQFEQFLNDLVSRNVVIAIDDFGTGYSSLARLISLPIHGVKIDRAFVQKIDGREEAPRTLLRTLFTLFTDLGLTITAEGVEQPLQRDWLLNNGVSKAQGYLFSKPLALPDAISLLQQLHYRPGAIPVNPGRVRATRLRRGMRSWFGSLVQQVRPRQHERRS